MTVRLSNGTCVRIGPGWAVTTLPDGQEVHAHPNSETAGMAQVLGYGVDVAGLTEDHDLLHSLLCDWLGQPHSYSLLAAAGQYETGELTALEEAAVLAVQKFAAALSRLEPHQKQGRGAG